MAAKHQPRSLAPWVTFVLATGTIAALVAWLLLGPGGPQAHGEPPTPEATAGFQTTEQLALTITLSGSEAKPKGVLHVELVGSDGKTIEEAQREVQVEKDVTSHRFQFKGLKGSPNKVTVRCRFAEQKPVEVALNKILLAKAHETALSAGQEFYAGSQAALRCEVHGVRSLTETVPLPGATVAVRLTGADGKAHVLYEGKAGANGVAAVQVKVPELPPGKYKMEVATTSTLGDEKLEREVTLKTAPRVMLVTDKPLYQPGQRIHLRALALEAFALTPVAGKDLTFEVEDAKNNKVFKKTLKTSDYGIAAADFDLADEVNAGDYHVRALLGDHTADKTVVVKPYVLPKFKVEVKADKKFYLPKETITADLQADYFFGKPVARGKVKVTASTFDVAFKDFQTWEGPTDEAGHAKFEIKLPDYFVGQPLAKGNALVKLEIKLTDTADHSEIINKTYPVSAQPIQVSLVPEGGRLVPGLENRVFAAAVYPDGSPAQCDVKVWLGNRAAGKPVAEVKTNEAGLAEVRISPRPEQFRQGAWGERKIEMLGEQGPPVWGPTHVLDITAEAKDAKGEKASATATLNSEPFGENVILRPDKAIYKGGDRVRLDVRSSAGLPTVYLDIVKSGQTVLTKWLDVKDGKAEDLLDLPPSVFGTLEVHAWQMLSHGEIIRDSRVIYVNPAADLKIDVKADKDIYAPGGKGTIRFEVTDSAGKPTAAALGVLIVDEAVYALQEMQPGLEKVYFTLQQELLKPQAQAVYKPAVGLDTIVREPIVADATQQVAEVLLTAVRPKPPARWEVNPLLERQRKGEEIVHVIGTHLFNYAQGNAFLDKDKKTGAWGFRPGLLTEMIKTNGLEAKAMTDPFGAPVTVESLGRLDKGFTAEGLAVAITQLRMTQALWQVGQYVSGNEGKYKKDGKWALPETVVSDVLKGNANERDAWGVTLRLVPRNKDSKAPNPWSLAALKDLELVSAGPDGKFGTADDVHLSGLVDAWSLSMTWWLPEEARQAHEQNQVAHGRWARKDMLNRNLEFAGGGRGAGFPPPPGLPGGGGFQGGFAGGPPLPVAAPGVPKAKEDRAPHAADPGTNKPTDAKGGGGGEAGGPAPPRLREYFPETLLWQPALITDAQGRAEMPVDFADSITTWRLTASASSRGGVLGGVDKPLRVFQDFFADIDLPVALTQNDEVAFPVAVYNYLKEPQTVTLDLKAEGWFELIDSQGLKRTLELKANEVTSVKYRIRAKKVGNFPLTVEAKGTRTSDAIKRSIDVQPDGKKVEQVVTDRLSGNVMHDIVIPDNAVADASKLFVKVHPGVMSQVLEGAEGLIRLPGG